MNIAITIVHNQGNSHLQIESLLKLVEKKGEVFVLEGEEYISYYYQLKEIDFPHRVKFYQVLPFGITPPPNLYELDSYKVFYGEGDEDKIGTHPRFFNWGLKRGTDNGAEISIYLQDYKKLSLKDLKVYINTLIDPNDPHEFIEDSSVKICSVKLLREIGQLNEKNGNPYAEYKGRIIQKGLKHV